MPLRASSLENPTRPLFAEVDLRSGSVEVVEREVRVELAAGLGAPPLNAVGRGGVGVGVVAGRGWECAG